MYVARFRQPTQRFHHAHKTQVESKACEWRVVNFSDGTALLHYSSFKNFSIVVKEEASQHMRRTSPGHMYTYICTVIGSPSTKAECFNGNEPANMKLIHSSCSCSYFECYFHFYPPLSQLNVSQEDETRRDLVL